jgi:hypothetical protein
MMGSPPFLMVVMEQQWTRRHQQDCRLSSFMPQKHPYRHILRALIGRWIKILPRGEAYFSGELGNIVKEHGLTKTQVLQQLLNYKREQFGYQQVAVILTSNNLEQRICEGMSMSTTEFVTQALTQIYLPGNPS